VAKESLPLSQDTPPHLNAEGKGCRGSFFTQNEAGVPARICLHCRRVETYARNELLIVARKSFPESVFQALCEQIFKKAKQKISGYPPEKDMRAAISLLSDRSNPNIQAARVYIPNGGTLTDPEAFIKGLIGAINLIWYIEKQPVAYDRFNEIVAYS